MANEEAVDSLDITKPKPFFAEEENPNGFYRTGHGRSCDYRNDEGN